MKLIAITLSFLVLIFSEVSLADYKAYQASVIKPDEQIIFFPSIGYQLPADSSKWKLEIHGWIFEPEFDGIKRRILLKSFAHSLSLLDQNSDNEIFNERARYFLVDNEQGKSVQIQVAGRKVLATPSGKDGHFWAEIEISDAEIKEAQNKNSESWLGIEAYSGLADNRVFTGKVFLLADEGIAVISDVDDTIKESAVTNKTLLLKNTFTRPFRAFDPMVSLYQSLAKEGATFHYITASPWQLYPALAHFINEYNYPNGTFDMKEFRWKDSRFFDLFGSPHKFKRPLIESLIKRFPKKKFILIGDSGEKDPEIYADIVRYFPKQDIQIIIREIPDAPMTTARSLKAFEGVKQERWKIIGE